LGFAGFKAGMTHVIMREDRPHNPYHGHERSKAVTVIEVPPMLLLAARGYTEETSGSRAASEIWIKPLPKAVQSYFKLPKNYDYEERKKEFESKIDQFTEVRALLVAQPALSGISQKRPILHEYGVGGGSVEEQVTFLMGLMGQEISVTDVFEEGKYADIIGVTKGKGFQGPVKRWGIKILQHKSRTTRRGVGSIGPWRPAHMMYTVPRAGQLGTHQRTEYNLRIVRIGGAGRDITPKGGFIRYGVVRSSYLIVLGSIPGPIRRFIRLRTALRPPSHISDKKPELIYIDAVAE
jgi:large subunit ribosomal protein L3